MSLKTIKATVGKECANIPSDVATVQYLLNCVPVSQGGPTKELVIDGFVGVVTTEAINRFQEFHFGSSDSVVKPPPSSEQTFDKLKSYDPLPNSSPIVLPNSDSRAIKFTDPNSRAIKFSDPDSRAIKFSDANSRAIKFSGPATGKREK